MNTTTTLNRHRRLLLVLVTALAAVVVAAGLRPAFAFDEVPGEKAEAAKDIYTPWTVQGAWKTTHPFWSDVLLVKPDGTFHTETHGMAGKWTLTAERGTPLLVLRWDRWSTESLLMIGPNHFRGQIESGKYMEMRRGDGVAKVKPSKAE